VVSDYRRAWVRCCWRILRYPGRSGRTGMAQPPVTGARFTRQHPRRLCGCGYSECEIFGMTDFNIPGLRKDSLVKITTGIRLP
jgi:hypothetical protein